MSAAAENRFSLPQIIALHLAFATTGVVTALLGPALPAARERLEVGNADIAVLFTAQYAAGAAGALFSQRGRRGWVVAGLALAAAGLAWFPYAPWPWAVAAWALVGFGVGAAIPATNMLVAHAFRRRAAAVNFLNFVWGAGAALAPLALAQLYRVASYRRALLVFAAFTLLTAVLAGAALARAGVSPGAAAAQAKRSGGAEFVLPCVTLFLYIGVETTLAGWLPTHAAIAAGVSAEAAARTAFFFWVALMAGRAVFSAALTRLPEGWTLLVTLLAAAVSVAAQMAARSMAEIAAAAAVAGFACAPVFGLLLSRIAALAEARGVSTPGWVFSVASMGGATVPWLFGRLADAAGSTHAAFALPLAACVALLAMVAAHGGRVPTNNR